MYIYAFYYIISYFYIDFCSFSNHIFDICVQIATRTIFHYNKCFISFVIQEETIWFDNVNEWRAWLTKNFIRIFLNFNFIIYIKFFIFTIISQLFYCYKITRRYFFLKPDYSKTSKAKFSNLYDCIYEKFIKIQNNQNCKYTNSK